MKHYGDITKLNGANLPPVNIICGGSPCQDLSIAGARKGLAGERSGLFMDQIRVIKEMRNESKRRMGLAGADVDIRLIRPRFMVWENVPGAFTSNKGEDFRCVLEETARIACKDAVIPRPPGGVDSFRVHTGRRVEHCLALTRCAVLGSTPKKKENLACRRFWRTHRSRDII